MPQSLSNILVHLIFSTKDRYPWFEAPELRSRAHAYLAGVVRRCDCEAYRVGGVADHVHLAIRLSRTLTIAGLVKNLKTGSNQWLKEHSPAFQQFAWQQGYGAFSIGMSQKEALLRYIDGQEEHHRNLTFQEEYRSFLRKYGVDFDERYLWD
ncbi:IS200/IS605 family transposase [Roseibacillus ishigakijimensis]|uniref:IS200/IS605 family transposase n=1 Tax=Roseibacillus ishigakijimensis TaxID=454146 RepID=A0A934VNW8_9BACT|nr:IS200/IS605 family transposase [Roseibacillus ishigakijimensis]MBK1835475.1 IS200/IS605 family transposase [Roseibacillus ishigakijimensis]